MEGWRDCNDKPLSPNLGSGETPMRHLASFLLAVAIPLLGETAGAQAALPPVEILATLPTPVNRVVATLNGQRLYYLTRPTPGVGGTAEVWLYDVPTRRSARVADGSLQQITVSPNGDRIAFSKSSGDINVVHIWTLPLDPITGLAAGVPRRASVGGGDLPFFSPDGSFIGFRGSDSARRLSVIPMNGGIERVLAHGMVRLYPSGWSADGSWIYFVGQRTYEAPFRLQRVSTIDGTTETILENVGIDGASLAPDGAHLSEAMPTDGYNALVDTNGTVLTNKIAEEWIGGNGWLTATKLLMVQHEHPRGLKTVSLSTGAVRDVLSPAYRVSDAAWAADGLRFAAVGELPGDSTRIIIAAADGSNRRT